jgi:hypothetical protein
VCRERVYIQYIHVYIYVHIYIYSSACASVRMCVWRERVCVYICTCIYVCIRICIHIYIERDGARERGMEAEQAYVFNGGQCVCVGGRRAGCM